MNFEEKVVKDTVFKLINGEDYRSEVINAINIQFLDFTISFFKKIIQAKLDSKNIDLDWYKENFIQNENLTTDDIAIYAGINKKTITNIHGSATKRIVLDVAESNFEYISNLILELEEKNTEKLGVQIKLTHNNISVDLTLAESLLVINALATKKISIRGGAWSSIGKKVEKPLMLELCKRCGVSKNYINANVFKKDDELDFDREVDFKLYSIDGKEIRCEVKLMGKGNPESADAVIARNSDIFIADTLSEQNKKQLEFLNVAWIELKNNSQDKIIEKFRNILISKNIKTSTF